MELLAKHIVAKMAFTYGPLSVAQILGLQTQKRYLEGIAMVICNPIEATLLQKQIN